MANKKGLPEAQPFSNPFQLSRPIFVYLNPVIYHFCIHRIILHRTGPGGTVGCPDGQQDILRQVHQVDFLRPHVLQLSVHIKFRRSGRPLNGVGVEIRGGVKAQVFKRGKLCGRYGLSRILHPRAVVDHGVVLDLVRILAEHFYIQLVPIIRRPGSVDGDQRRYYRGALGEFRPRADTAIFDGADRPHFGAVIEFALAIDYGVVGRRQQLQGHKAAIDADGLSGKYR